MKVYPIFNKDYQDKFKMYLKATNTRDYIIYLIGTTTGLRVSDIVKLKVTDISKGFINVVEQKTGKTKRCKLNQELKELLNSYIKGLKGVYLLPTRQSSHISTRQVQRIIKKVAEKLGIAENINSHSLRKTYAYNLYNVSNNNIALVMEALNHSKESITLKYLCIGQSLLDSYTDLL